MFTKFGYTDVVSTMRMLNNLDVLYKPITYQMVKSKEDSDKSLLINSINIINMILPKVTVTK